MPVSINMMLKIKVAYGNKSWINKIDPYEWFQCILGTGWVEDQKMMKDKLIDGKEL